MKINQIKFIPPFFRAIILILLVSIYNFFDSNIIIYIITAYIFFDIFVINKLDYTKITVVYNIPWLLIFLFSMMNLSYYSRPVSDQTIFLCSISVILFNLFASSSFSTSFLKETKYRVFYSKKWALCFDLLFVFLTISNIALSGYIPLINGIVTGNTEYTTFGIGGLYGFYLAYANAYGVLLFYLYLINRQKRFLIKYFMIIAIFVLFITRQNIISLFVESFFIYTIYKGKTDIKKLVLFVFIILGLFSIIGNFRSGDISQIVWIRSEYDWLPSPIIWLYSYFYFNILNLDNLLSHPAVPLNDYSSFASFIPSFLRPETVSLNGDTLEVINFNVSSYIYPLYKDMGEYWVWGFTLLVAILSKKCYDNFIKNNNFQTMAIVAVLYFCAFMSFFINFWAYLPIIFQIFFIYIFCKTIIKE